MRCMLHISEPAIGDGTEVIFSEEGTGLKRWLETSGWKIGKIAYLRKNSDLINKIGAVAHLCKIANALKNKL